MSKERNPKISFSLECAHLFLTISAVTRATEGKSSRRHFDCFNCLAASDAVQITTEKPLAHPAWSIEGYVQPQFTPELIYIAAVGDVTHHE